MTSVSVIIPTLDEAEDVARAIASVVADAEVIVVDGGSQDATCAIAAAAGACVIASPRGRGRQLDAGARHAKGKWLVFLHADTWLEPGWAEALQGLPADSSGGAFRFAVDSPRRGYRLIEAMVAARCRLLQLPYGDQALFAHRTSYGAAGGFPPLLLFEDVAFVRRLRRQGPLSLLAPRAYTSPRRWERHGLVRNTLRNWSLLALYAAGLPPEQLARHYRPHAKPTRAV